MKIIAEFIPMILLLVFLVFSEKFIELGNTVLGKLFFVTLIIFYARINKYLGLMVCFLVITFYNITNPIIKKFENFDGSISQMEKIGAQEESAEVAKLKEQNDYEMKERQMELDAEQLRISQEQRKQEQMEAAKEKEYREAKDIVKNRKNYDRNRGDGKSNH